MISPNAQHCPQCGEPAPHTTQKQMLIGVGIVVLFAIAMVAYMDHRSSEAQRELKEFRQRQPQMGSSP
jgi:hypothetical protein